MDDEPKWRTRIWYDKDDLLKWLYELKKEIDSGQIEAARRSVEDQIKVVKERK